MQDWSSQSALQWLLHMEGKWKPDYQDHLVEVWEKSGVLVIDYLVDEGKARGRENETAAKDLGNNGSWKQTETACRNGILHSDGEG